MTIILLIVIVLILNELNIFNSLFKDFKSFKFLKLKHIIIYCYIIAIFYFIIVVICGLPR